MPKYECSFCGKTNTKWEGVYESSGFLGLGETKIGEKEVMNDEEVFYRCVSCGRFYCKEHYENICKKTRQEKGWLTNKTIHFDECPKCGSNEIKKV